MPPRGSDRELRDNIAEAIQRDGMDGVRAAERILQHVGRLFAFYDECQGMIENAKETASKQEGA